MSRERLNTKFASDTELPQDQFPQHRIEHGRAQRNSGQPLRVMKFGGTSVGDAASIRKVLEIIRRASEEGDLLVVVSAMSGVTNKLIEAATQAELGHRGQATRILNELRQQHEAVAKALIHSETERNRIGRTISGLFEQCQSRCESTATLGQLTSAMRDSISSLGERLTAPLVAAALVALGVASEAIEATELVVTDADHGAADPQMDLTRARCEARLHPLLQQGIIPVVTGFIGATENGVLTTLGRGGSDYSATILGAALKADQVTIWTDVDGMLTADPHLVPEANTIPEISYREAAELAYFGARVLHPKTLRPVMQSGIPVWIRNTFAPEKAGTKITPAGHASNGEVKALTAVSDAAMITVGCQSTGTDVVARTLAATAALRTDVLMISHSPARNHLRLVVAAGFAQRTVEALRREFAAEPNYTGTVHVRVDSAVAILTVVGQNLHVVQGIVARASDELSRENVDILACAPGSSACNVSFVVARKDLRTALVTTHREFQLCVLDLPPDGRPEAQLL